MSTSHTTTVKALGTGVQSLLLTGQFWHNEFADLVNGLTVPTTLMRTEQLLELREWNPQFGLILVCKERRGSIDQGLIEQLKTLAPGTPIVVLLGSWCEGESRSGTPLTGVTNIYWHQWQGDFIQLQSFVSGQHWPIALADATELLEAEPQQSQLFAISALTSIQYEMMAEAISALGGKSVWLEKTSWQAEPIDSVLAIIVDGDSRSESLSRRVALAQSLAPDRPVICTMGFPRKNEVQDLRAKFGVSQVVSKPFDLSQLYHAIRQSTGVELPCVPKANPDLGGAIRPVNPGLDTGTTSIRDQQQAQ